MSLFHEDDLSIANRSGNKQVFKATLSLDITCSRNAEEFIQGYCDYSSEGIKVFYTLYDVYFISISSCICILAKYVDTILQDQAK